MSLPNVTSIARPERRRRLFSLVTVTALVAAISLTSTSPAFAAPTTPPGPAQPGSAQPGPARPGPDQPDFGPNVRIFDPSMPTSQIQAEVDAIKELQINDEMGTNRYALLFKPGSYGNAEHPLMIQVGYYTEVAGLGQNPTDVTINGHVEVYNRCRPASGCIALDNFWRSMSNLTINVTGGEGCRASANFWAASQASPVRRVNITGGNLSLMDYCTDGPQFASGGFIADSKTGFVINGSQQQYIVRNSSVGGWSNGVWNQVFSGVAGAPAECFPAVKDVCGPYTTLDKTRASKEKPYLYIDSAGQYRVFVPDPGTNSTGPTWENGATPGHGIPLSNFYMAKPSDSVQTINKQLKNGKNLLFTPGVFTIDKTIEVQTADTVVLGIGMATLTAVNGAVVMAVNDVPGVDIAGLTIDAGTKKSAVLLQIGSSKKDRKDKKATSSSSNPTGLQDVFFRIGGPNVGKADISLEVNSDNVILDDIWAWRADHGNAGTVGWNINTAKNGVVVNGDNVTATGLFVEHYQQHNVIWNGNGGEIVFFQNELAYDPPSQAAWMQAPGVNGWSALKVADSVKTFKAYALGSYSFFNQGVDIFAANAFEVPDTLAPGSLHNMTTIFLDPNKGKGGISNVINGIGGPSIIGNADMPVTVTDYPAVPDTVAPTVAITDNVAAATATGDVTYTFSFSEGVGTSFAADDIVVAVGTKSTFVRVDATHATLVVAPAVNSTGTINVSVAAGTFSDAAGNTNTASAAAQQAYDTVVSPPPPPSGSLITIDEATPPTLTGFGGANPTIVVDPANPANKVAQVVKGVGSAIWAGTTVSTLPNTAVQTIAFGATKTMLKARVWSPDAGIPVRLKVENAADPTQSVETEATTTVAGGWETLTFDFARHAPGTAALNLAFTYNKVSIFFDFGTDGTGKTYYLDNLNLAPTGAGTPPPPPAASSQITFDDAAVQYALTDFGLYGATGAVVPDPAGGSNTVAKVFKTTGSEQWGGTTVSTGSNQSVATIPFTSTSTKMTLRVYSPTAGIRVRMKVESAGNPGINCETDAFTMTSGAWETLTFDFGDSTTHYIPNGPTTYDIAKPTAALNVANTYNKVSVFFDFGRGNGGYAPMASDQIYYFDDLSFVS